MSSYLPNAALPVQKVLDFFGITLDQYFKLAEVPFPVVTEYGRVIYDTYQYYDATASEPTDSGRSDMTPHQILRDGYIDYGMFKNEGSKAFKFRYRRLGNDENRTDLTYDAEFMSTQTKDSSTWLYLDRNTGIHRKDFRLQSKSYPFSSFDVVNCVHPDYTKITDGKHKGVYDPVSNTIIIEPLSTRTSKTTTQSGNTFMSIQTDSLVEQNKQALITATKLEVGTLALDLVSAQVVKTLPVPVQVLVGENPLVKVAIANVINLILAQTSVDDERLLAVNEAMMTVAWMETIKTLDIKSMVEAALGSLPAAKLEALVAAKKVSE